MKIGFGTGRFSEDVIRLMVPIEGGTVELRDYMNRNKWFSSDYTLADPGRERDRKLIIRTETIDPFYVMKYPVTKGLYYDVIFEKELAANEMNLPMTEVSWTDAIVFCNQLSKILGRTECYTSNFESEYTSYNHNANGFRLLTDAEWQYACKAGTKE